MVEALNIHACTAYALGNVLMVHYARRDVASIERIARQMYAHCEEGGYLLWTAQARIYLGWAQAMTGSFEAGIEEMKAGMESYRLTGSDLMKTQFCLMLADVQSRARRPGEALAALSRGIRYVEESQEHAHEPELHRRRGEILIAQGATSAGEVSLKRAIETARTQQARMLELRAALSLSKFLLDQGRKGDVAPLLQPIVESFTEGYQTPELDEASAVLQSVGCAAPSTGA
jgi:predicted ATPase